MRFFLTTVLISILFTNACKEDEVIPREIQITSSQFIDDLLLVDRDNFQIETKQSATFSSSDSFIQISSTGLIKRITSAEVVAIDVVSNRDSTIRKTIYALGVKDDNYDKPNVDFNGLSATDAYNSYLQGWKTLQKLPVENETYAMILRHADADQGRDWGLEHPVQQGPANWWKSCDSSLARQLNNYGRARAKELGNILKDLQFPITRVISSEFCRAKETASLVNAGPGIVIDGRLNNLSHNVIAVNGVFNAVRQIVSDQPADNKMTLISTHHPANELHENVVATFPNVIPFAWTGSYFIKIAPDKTITFEGAVSYGMFKYWRDKKLNRLATARL
jgi:phosphohistidine phosphatase SixA